MLIPNAAVAWLCVLAAIVPLAFSASFYEPYLAAKTVVLVAGAAAAAVICSASFRELPVTRLWWPLGFLAGICALAFVPATRPDTAACLLAALLLFAAAVWCMAEKTGREVLATVVCAAGALEAVIVLWQAVAGDPLFQASALPGKWRTFGTFGNPNWTGEFLAMALLVAVARLTGKWSRAGFFTAALIAAALAATFARGAWLACLAGMAVILAARRGSIPGKLRAALWALPAIGLAVAAILASRPDVFRYLVNTASLRGRVWIWHVTLRMIAEHPFGVGLGAFGLHYPEVQARCFQTEFGRAFLSSAAFPQQAHNDYLQLAAEAGIPALAAVAALVWLVLRQGRTLADDGPALGFRAAVVAMLVNAAYASPFYLPGSLAMIAIFLGASEAAVARRRAIAVPRVARALACAAVLAVAVVAWHWCWRVAASEIALQRAAAALAAGSWDSAAAALDDALRQDRRRMEAYSMAGRLALARRDFTAARQAYTRAEALGTGIEVLTGKATALWHADQGPAAVAVLEKLMWLRPDLEWPRRRVSELRASLPAPAGRTQ